MEWPALPSLNTRLIGVTAWLYCMQMPIKSKSLVLFTFFTKNPAEIRSSFCFFCILSLYCGTGLWSRLLSWYLRCLDLYLALNCSKLKGAYRLKRQKHLWDVEKMSWRSAWCQAWWKTLMETLCGGKLWEFYKIKRTLNKKDYLILQHHFPQFLPTGQ